MDEIALTQNATMAMNFLANGMTFNPGDEILTTDQEHGGGVPSNNTGIVLANKIPYS